MFVSFSNAAAEYSTVSDMREIQSLFFQTQLRKSLLAVVCDFWRIFILNNSKDI